MVFIFAIIRNIIKNKHEFNDDAMLTNAQIKLSYKDVFIEEKKRKKKSSWLNVLVKLHEQRLDLMKKWTKSGFCGGQNAFASLRILF